MSATLPSTIPSLTGPTVEDVFHRFGAIPIGRIRMDRYPATEDDLLEVHAQEGRICELVDDMLVEKAVGAQESNIALKVSFLIQLYLADHDLGDVFGADGFLRLQPGKVRAPDLSFISWDQFPGRKIPKTPIPAVHPDLVVEVLSEGNTEKEMEVKREEYFDTGSSLVWIIDPKTRTLAAYTPDSRHNPAVFTAANTVSAEPVLPGFSFPIAKLFEKLA